MQVQPTQDMPAVAVPTLDQEKPVVIDPKQKYHQDWNKFRLQPEIVGMRQRIVDLGKEKEDVQAKPANLEREYREAWEQRTLLVAELQKPGHGKREMAKMVESKNQLNRRILQLPGEIEEAERILPLKLSEIPLEQGMIKGRIQQKQDGWAKEGDTDRVVFYAFYELKEHPVRRERLFREFALQCGGITEYDLNSMFNRIVRDSERSDIPGKVVRRSAKDGNDNSTGFGMVTGRRQEPKPIVSRDDLRQSMHKIDGLAGLTANDVWRNLQFIAGLTPDEFSQYEKVKNGPFKNWTKVSIGRMWVIICKFEGGKLIFSVGSHDRLLQ